MRIYLLKGRHGFRPQDGFKFMSVVPNVKDLFLFSDAKLLHCCELFVRYYVVFAFLLINIPISIRFTIKGIIYYIITITHYILCICTSVFSIVRTLIVFIRAFKSTLGINMFIVVTVRIFQIPNDDHTIVTDD